MKITAVSPFTGKEQRERLRSEQQLALWRGGMLIQDAMPGRVGYDVWLMS